MKTNGHRSTNEGTPLEALSQEDRIVSHNSSTRQPFCHNCFICNWSERRTFLCHYKSLVMKAWLVGCYKWFLWHCHIIMEIFAFYYYTLVAWEFFFFYGRWPMTSDMTRESMEVWKGLLHLRLKFIGTQLLRVCSLSQGDPPLVAGISEEPSHKANGLQMCW